MEVNTLKGAHPSVQCGLPDNTYPRVKEVVLNDVSLASSALLGLALVVEAFSSILFVILGNQLIVALMYMLRV